MDQIKTVSPRHYFISREKRAGLKYLLLSLPFLVFVFAFSYVPLYSWIYSFFHYQIGHTLSDMTFVGFDNFAKLLNQSDKFLRVMRNTLVMSLLNVVCTPLPVIFAIMLNSIRNSKFKRFVQTATTLPNFISWIIVFGIATLIFSSGGLVSTVQDKFNIRPSEINILGNVNAVWLFQLALGIWKSLGWSAIIYIAAIAGIDEEQYDAVKVDGANKLQTIFHVTIPGLIPTFLVLLLLNISNLLNNGLEQYFVFWNPLVSDRIEVLDFYVYQVGILAQDYSFSVVLGMFKTLISIILLFTCNGISKKLRGNSLV